MSRDLTEMAIENKISKLAEQILIHNADISDSSPPVITGVIMAFNYAEAFIREKENRRKNDRPNEVREGETENRGKGLQVLRNGVQHDQPSKFSSNG